MPGSNNRARKERKKMGLSRLLRRAAKRGKDPSKISEEKRVRSNQTGRIWVYPQRVVKPGSYNKILAKTNLIQTQQAATNKPHIKNQTD